MFSPCTSVHERILNSSRVSPAAYYVHSPLTVVMTEDTLVENELAVLDKLLNICVEYPVLSLAAYTDPSPYLSIPISTPCSTRSVIELLAESNGKNLGSRNSSAYVEQLNSDLAHVCGSQSSLDSVFFQLRDISAHSEQCHQHDVQNGNFCNACLDTTVASQIRVDTRSPEQFEQLIRLQGCVNEILCPFQVALLHANGLDNFGRHPVHELVWGTRLRVPRLLHGHSTLIANKQVFLFQQEEHFLHLAYSLKHSSLTGPLTEALVQPGNIPPSILLALAMPPSVPSLSFFTSFFFGNLTNLLFTEQTVPLPVRNSTESRLFPVLFGQPALYTGESYDHMTMDAEFDLFDSMLAEEQVSNIIQPCLTLKFESSFDPSEHTPLNSSLKHVVYDLIQLYSCVHQGHLISLSVAPSEQCSVASPVLVALEGKLTAPQAKQCVQNALLLSAHHMIETVDMSVQTVVDALNFVLSTQSQTVQTHLCSTIQSCKTYVPGIHTVRSRGQCTGSCLRVPRSLGLSSSKLELCCFCLVKTESVLVFGLLNRLEYGIALLSLLQQSCIHYQDKTVHQFALQKASMLIQLCELYVPIVLARNMHSVESARQIATYAVPGDNAIPLHGLVHIVHTLKLLSRIEQLQYFSLKQVQSVDDNDQLVSTSCRRGLALKGTQHMRLAEALGECYNAGVGDFALVLCRDTVSPPEDDNDQDNFLVPCREGVSYPAASNLELSTHEQINQTVIQEISSVARALDWDLPARLQCLTLGASHAAQSLRVATLLNDDSDCPSSSLACMILSDCLAQLGTALSEHPHTDLEGRLFVQHTTESLNSSLTPATYRKLQSVQFLLLALLVDIHNVKARTTLSLLLQKTPQVTAQCTLSDLSNNAATIGTVGITEGNHISLRSVLTSHSTQLLATRKKSKTSIPEHLVHVIRQSEFCSAEELKQLQRTAMVVSADEELVDVIGHMIHPSMLSPWTTDVRLNTSTGIVQEFIPMLPCYKYSAGALYPFEEWAIPIEPELGMEYGASSVLHHCKPHKPVLALLSSQQLVFVPSTARVLDSSAVAQHVVTFHSKQGLFASSSWLGYCDQHIVTRFSRAAAVTSQYVSQGLSETTTRTTSALLVPLPPVAFPLDEHRVPVLFDGRVIDSMILAADQSHVDCLITLYDVLYNATQSTASSHHYLEHGIPCPLFSLQDLVPLLEYIHSFHPPVRCTQASLLNELGTEKRNLGLYTQAVQLYEQALQIDPTLSCAWYNLGVISASTNVQTSIEAYQQAILIKPDYFEALNNLGIQFKEQGHVAAAIELYQRALQVAPQAFQTLNNLSVAYNIQGNTEESLAVCLRALQLCPDYSSGWNNLGVLYRDIGKPKEALNHFHKAWSYDQNNIQAIQNALLSLNSLPVSERFIAQQHARIGKAIEAAMQCHQPTPTSSPPLFLSSKPTYRVGFVSPDQFGHSVTYFLQAILAQYEMQSGGHHRLHYIAFYTGTVVDGYTTRMKALFPEWHDVPALDSAQLLQTQRSHNLDIVIELSGHTASNSLSALSARAAPVQLSYLGYPNSTGLRSMDYRIVDFCSDPVIAPRFVLERLLRMPSPFLCYVPPESPVYAKQATNNKFVFGCFNALAKLTPRCIYQFSVIMHHIPHSMQLLKAKPLKSASIIQEIQDKFELMGIARHRVQCLSLLPTTSAHLNAYNAVDLSLDVFPYSGTTTTCESLYSFTPCLTLANPAGSHANNVSRSLIQRLVPISMTEEEIVEDCLCMGNEEETESKNNGLPLHPSIQPTNHVDSFLEEEVAPYFAQLPDLTLHSITTQQEEYLQPVSAYPPNFDYLSLRYRQHTHCERSLLAEIRKTVVDLHALDSSVHANGMLPHTSLLRGIHVSSVHVTASTELETLKHICPAIALVAESELEYIQRAVFLASNRPLLSRLARNIQRSLLLSDVCNTSKYCHNFNELLCQVIDWSVAHRLPAEFCLNYSEFQ